MALIEGIKLDLGNVWQGLGGLVTSIREAITGEPSPEKKAQAEAALMQMQFLLAQGQQKINEIEAAHQSVFVAGWRPAVGWVCAAGFAWHYVVSSFLFWILAIFGVKIPPLPILDMGELMTLLFGMLGLAGYRTYEKKQGVQGTH